MAFKLDNALLEELGLAALSADEKQAMLRQILETLEMRVGTTLASRMTDQQLDEFERLMPAEGDDQATVQQKEQQALQWLEGNFPNYKQVVNDELGKLKSEIRQSAPQIVAASQQAAPPAVGVDQGNNLPQQPAPVPQPTFDFPQSPPTPPAPQPPAPASPYQPAPLPQPPQPYSPTSPANDSTTTDYPQNPPQAYPPQPA